MMRRVSAIALGCCLSAYGPGTSLKAEEGSPSGGQPYGDRVEWHQVSVGVEPPSPQDDETAANQRRSFGGDASAGPVATPALAAPPAPRPAPPTRDDDEGPRPWITAEDFEKAEDEVGGAGPYDWLEEARNEFIDRETGGYDEPGVPSEFEEDPAPNPYALDEARDELGEELSGVPGEGEQGRFTYTTVAIPERPEFAEAPDGLGTDSWGSGLWRPGEVVERDRPDDTMPRTHELLAGTLEKVRESLRPSYGTGLTAGGGLGTELGTAAIGTPGNRTRRLGGEPASSRSRFAERTGWATAGEPSAFGPREPAGALDAAGSPD
jgi:hypothetical protein